MSLESQDLWRRAVEAWRVSEREAAFSPYAEAPMLIAPLEEAKRCWHVREGELPLFLAQLEAADSVMLCEAKSRLLGEGRGRFMEHATVGQDIDR